MSGANSPAPFEDTAAEKSGGRFTIRAYRPGDEASINRGFNAAFGLQRSLDEWRRKFAERPAGRWILVAVDKDNEVVAHYGAVPVRVQVDGRIFLAGQPVDVYRLRRPDLGRSHLIIDLTRQFFGTFGAPDRLALMYGFPSEYHLQLGLAKMGYGAPVPVPVWTRSRRTRRAWWTRHAVRYGLDTVALNDLWRACAPRYPVAVVRDGEYLQQRYGDRPGVEYTHLSAWKGGTMCAWLALRFRDGVAYWVDLIWNGNDVRALAALDSQAASLARRWGAERNEMWLTNDPAAEAVLAQRGWTAAPHSTLQLATMSFQPGVNPDELARRYYLTMGDSDLI